MKRSHTVALWSMGVSVLALTACSSDSELLPAKAYATIEECIADGSFSKAQCQQAMFAAQDAYEAAYPKFESEAQCEDVAGEGNCEFDRPNSRDRQWRPSMAAFLIAMGSSRVQPQAIVRSASSTSGFSTASGAHVARSGSAVSVPASAAARPTSAQVTRAVTTTRGGFGSSAVAHASTGGSRGGG